MALFLMEVAHEVSLRARDSGVQIFMQPGFHPCDQRRLRM